MTRSRLAIAVASVVVLALVGACSGEPEPGFGPSEPSSPPVGEESAAEPIAQPAMPPAAHGKGGSAARAFVHFWLKTLNYAIESGDSAALGAISSPTCKECGRIVKTIDDIYGRGGRLSGGTWRMTSLRALPVDRGADWAGYVTAAVSEQKMDGTRRRERAGPTTPARGSCTRTPRDSGTRGGWSGCTSPYEHVSSHPARGCGPAARRLGTSRICCGFLPAWFVERGGGPQRPQRHHDRCAGRFVSGALWWDWELGRVGGRSEP